MANLAFSLSIVPNAESKFISLNWYCVPNNAKNCFEKLYLLNASTFTFLDLYSNSEPKTNKFRLLLDAPELSTNSPLLYLYFDKTPALNCSVLPWLSKLYDDVTQL